MTKISYPVKIRFLSFTCEDITVFMATSVSANETDKSYMPYCYKIRNTKNTYFLHFSGKILMCVRSIFYWTDSGDKGLFPENVILVFYWCLENKQKITWRLGDTTFNFSC